MSWQPLKSHLGSAVSGKSALTLSGLHTAYSVRTPKGKRTARLQYPTSQTIDTFTLIGRDLVTEKKNKENETSIACDWQRLSYPSRGAHGEGWRSWGKVPAQPYRAPAIADTDMTNEERTALFTNGLESSTLPRQLQAKKKQIQKCRTGYARLPTAQL